MKAALIKRFETEIAALERELTQDLPKEIQRAREHGDLLLPHLWTGITKVRPGAGRTAGHFR